MVLCNDIRTEQGVTFHCRVKAAEHTGRDHAAGTGHLTWPVSDKAGPRWTKRHPASFLWHAIADSVHTVCGDEIIGLAPTTIKGRTQVRPPANAHVCPKCSEASK